MKLQKQSYEIYSYYFRLKKYEKNPAEKNKKFKKL